MEIAENVASREFITLFLTAHFALSRRSTVCKPGLAVTALLLQDGVQSVLTAISQD